jgi:hypothetical protein
MDQEGLRQLAQLLDIQLVFVAARRFLIGNQIIL